MRERGKSEKKILDIGERESNSESNEREKIEK